MSACLTFDQFPLTHLINSIIHETSCKILYIMLAILHQDINPFYIGSYTGILSNDINLLPPGTFCMFFLSSADFFFKSTFLRNTFRNKSECQTVWIQIRPDIKSGLIWVQTVWKGYQQRTPVGKELRLV